MVWLVVVVCGRQSGPGRAPQAGETPPQLRLPACPPPPRTQHQVLPGDETVLRGRCEGSGVCIKRTNTALVIGTYDPPVVPGDVNVIVENLGDYLREQQF